MDIIKILAEDKSLITYRPSLRPIGGSVSGTILLQQIIYWWNKSKGKFYKFIEPCHHDLYKAGDSWSEELGMSAKEIRTALEHIAFKCGSKNKELHGDQYESKKSEMVVVYYTDVNRVTWYSVNESLLCKLLMGVYKVSDQREVTYHTVSETTTKTTHSTDFTPSAKAKTDLQGVPIPPTPNVAQPPSPEPLPFQSQAFADAWESWEKHRREIRKKLTPSTSRMQLNKCAKWGEKKAIETIKRSIENGWMGLFESTDTYKKQENIDTRKKYGY